MKTAVYKAAAILLGYSLLTGNVWAQDSSDKQKCQNAFGRPCKQLQQYPAVNDVPENPIKNFGKTQNGKPRFNAPAVKRWAVVRYS